MRSARFGLLALTLLGCDRPAVSEAAPQPVAAAPDNPVADALAPVRAREAALIGLRRPAWSSVSGPDPTAVRPWRDGYLGLLRSGALVHLDASGHERARLGVVSGATGWARVGDRLAVVGEGAGIIELVDLSGEAPVLERWLPVQGMKSLRAIAADPGTKGGWFVADRHRGRIVAVGPDGQPGAAQSCAGAIDVQVHDRWVVADCLLEHRVRVFDLKLRPIAAVQHDGPIWSVAARTAAGTLELALGGVEDHPLEREDGAFGYIDSFVFHLRLEGEALRRVAAINVSEAGVVTPKHLAWHDETLWVSGAGGEAFASVDLGSRTVTPQAVPAGLTAFARTDGAWLAADPLLDHWVHIAADGATTLVPIAGEDTRTEAVRLGEALVFTTLMAPQAASQGRASRFTCETCHFEGTVDGRVHHTGRGQVHATTKTLRGLVGNRPHFSRALDRTTVGMIHNEFRVANARTPQDPWFTLETADHPWLSTLTRSAQVSPAELRGAVLEFLVAFTPEDNPATFARHAFSELERRGAEVFSTACEGCHQARTVADDPISRVEPASWEAEVFDGGTLLWASEERYKTGVEPYVHDDGARVPSLRRLWVKRPYLTQGGAPQLADVLSGVRLQTDAVHGAGEGEPLSTSDREALLAFLDLL